MKKNPLKEFRCEKCGMSATGIFNRQYLCKDCFRITKMKSKLSNTTKNNKNSPTLIKKRKDRK